MYHFYQLFCLNILLIRFQESEGAQIVVHGGRGLKHFCAYGKNCTKAWI